MRFALILLASITIPTASTAQFTLQTSNTTADLRGIDNVGNGVAWASGTNGTVLRTEDGGYMWQSCSMPPGAEKLDFRGIQAFDANTAIVMSSGPGNQSRLYKTTDGCHTWKLLFTNPDKDGFWDAVNAGGREMFILGDPVNGSFVLEESHDAGKTWHRNPLPPSLVNEGAFAASNSSLVSAAADGMMFFGTGGPSGARIFTMCVPCASPQFEKTGWAVQMISYFGDGASVGIFSIAGNNVDAPSTLIAVGGDYSKPDSTGASAYSLGRISWHPSTIPPHGYRSSVAYDPSTKTWITVGPNGTDISRDDGRTWIALRPGPGDPPGSDKNWTALSLPWAVGPHGRIGLLRPEALHP
jgi:photosystem II stability/assembly factor-like uncharacterized protein